MFAPWWDICTFVPSIKEPETPTRSGSVLLWGPAWVRPITTWSGGETNTVFVFVFFEAFLRQMRLLCLFLGKICFFFHGSMRQLSDKALPSLVQAGPWKWSVHNHFLLKDREKRQKMWRNSYLGVRVKREAFPVQIWMLWELLLTHVVKHGITLLVFSQNV